MWENILKKDSDLTDDQQKTLEEMTRQLTETFKKFDLKELNLMFGKNSNFSSKEELMSHMVKRIKTAMKAGLIKKQNRFRQYAGSDDNKENHQDVLEIIERLNVVKDGIYRDMDKVLDEQINVDEMKEAIRNLHRGTNILESYYG